MKKIDNPEEFINRRRRQLHVHSVIYYFLNTSIIDDAVFDTWAVELANAQREYPQYRKSGHMWTVFQDWTGDTGMHLPTTERVLALAERLVERSQKGTGPRTPNPKKKAQKRAERVNVVGYESP